MLGISTETLQNLRNNGTQTATKMGGLMFYDYNDIENLMKPGKMKNPVIARRTDIHQSKAIAPAPKQSPSTSLALPGSNRNSRIKIDVELPVYCPRPALDI